MGSASRRPCDEITQTSCSTWRRTQLEVSIGRPGDRRGRRAGPRTRRTARLTTARWCAATARGNLLGNGTFRDRGRPGPGDRPGHRLGPLAPGRRRGRGRGGPRDRQGRGRCATTPACTPAASSTPSRPSCRPRAASPSALGQALFEEMLFDGGQLQNGNLADYMIASIEDMPHDLALSIAGAPASRTRSTASARRPCRRSCRRRQRRLPRHRRAHHGPADHAREECCARLRELRPIGQVESDRRRPDCA